MVSRGLYINEFENKTEVTDDSDSCFSYESDTKTIDSAACNKLPDISARI